MTEQVPAQIRDEIAALAAYRVQDARGFIKLDAMENPYPFPPALREGLTAALERASLARYPDPAAVELCTAIRKAMHIPQEMDLLLGNGSDEIIQMIALALAKPGASILSVEPAFVMFKMIATLCGLRYVGVPLRSDFSLDPQAITEIIAREKPVVIFLAYPNNPTGNLFNRAAIRQIIQSTDGLVVIDEAYFAFSPRTFLSELNDFPNVVLMRTVSKLGLAGLRLGFLIGARRWLEQFNKVRLPYNINVFTQAAATFALQHIELFQAQADDIVRERQNLETQLDELFARHPGTERFASDANFILIRVPHADTVFEELKSRKVLVKNTGGGHPLLANTLRITVGTASENAAFVDALQSAL